MTAPSPTVFDHLAGQLARLSSTVGLGDTGAAALDILPDLLGAAAEQQLGTGPIWPSDVADDHSPVEFSLAMDTGRAPALRLLGETISERPDVVQNAHQLRHFLQAAADRFDLSLDRFNRVADLFLPGNYDATFLLWYSLVLRPGRRPDFKVYFNPAAQGPENAREIVAEALARVGLGPAYDHLARHTLCRGDHDQPVFFALDLHDQPHSRVKVYVAHEDASAADAVRCADPINGVEADRLIDFCSVAGRTDRFSSRPLISSYTYVSPDTDRPSVYSLYLPIRDYVSDDEAARERTATVLTHNGFQPDLLDRAIRCLTDRPLAEGSGLIAHVSLRLGAAMRPGVTVYLSSEAHAVSRPRQLN
jgi:tryptophan dimethylallyltransferase